MPTTRLKKIKSLIRCAPFSLALFTGCSRNMLEVHTDYVSIESLASFYIGTPDPLLNCPPFGQRLLISWSVSQCILHEPDACIVINLRYRNREEKELTIPLKKTSGTYVYTLLNNEYCETGGLLTYKAQLIAGGCVREEWRHQLWAELIRFEEPPAQEVPSEL